MQGIHKHTKPDTLRLFLAKPNRKIVSPLKYASNKKLNLHEDSPHELSFSLPYDILDNHVVESYEPTEQLREKFLIKALYKNEEMWFVIKSYNKNSNDADLKDVQCYSYEHTLGQKKLIDFHRESVNLTTVAEEVAKRYGWEIGYINPNLNLSWREFDISSTPVLSFFYDDLTETYNAVVVFDTVNKKINFYEQGELSNYKGFTISEGRYLVGIEEEVDSTEVVTRLHVTGSDGLGIQRVNPTGQRYIDDFSYYLYPFEMDEDGNVIRSSNFMEDDLAKAIIEYNQYVSSRNDEFYNYYTEKSKIQKEISEEEIKLFDLNVELQTIKDSIAWRKEQGINTSDLIKERNAKNSEVSKQEIVIKNLNNKVKDIDESIENLREDLKMENHFSPTLLDNLQDYIHEHEWTDDKKIDENDLYESGLEKLTEINSPPVNISTTLVNFLEDVNAQDDWDRLHLGDIVRIKHDKLRINTKARLSTISIDFEAPSIDVEISNMKELNDIANKLKSMYYTIDKVSTDFNKRRIDYDRVTNNFNLRNDRVSEIPATPTVGKDAIQHEENDNASVDITVRWQYPDFNKTKQNEHNIDGFMLYFYSDDTDETYQFTSQMAHEQITAVPYPTRTFVYPALPSNKFYTIGVRAYRRVDADINSDGILMSPIIRFNDGLVEPETQRLATFSRHLGIVPINEVSTFSEDISKPYQPSKDVNFKGKLFGHQLYLESTPPSSPSVDDVWFDKSNNQWLRWDGENWVGDLKFKKLDEEFAKFTEEMKEFEETLQKELEKNDGIVKEALQEVADEMERIYNEVLPEVEQTVSENIIPSYDIPPDVPPPSGLYWDTSHSPPRMMRWDFELGQYIPLALTEGEINEAMRKMREEAISESAKYSKETVIRVRKQLQDKLMDEIGNISEGIQDLLDIKDELIKTADTIDELLDEYDGKFTEFEHTVDELNKKVSTSITDIERIDNTVSGHSTELITQAGLIRGKLDSIEYTRDKTDILSSIEQNRLDIEATSEGLELMVSKEEYQLDMEGVDERIASTETGLEIVAGQISAKAEKSELLNFVDKSTYNRQVGELTTSIDGITGKVQNVETELNKATGEISSALSQIGELKITTGSITQSVTELRGDFDSEISSLSGSIETLAGEVKLKASQTSVDDLNKDITSLQGEIKLLPDRINLAVSEGIEDLEIGGRNLITLDSVLRSGAVVDGHKFTLTRSGTGNPYVRIPHTLFENNTDYVITFKVRKISGTVHSMAGHVESIAVASSTVILRDGVEIARGRSWSTGDRNSYPDDNEMHRYEIRFRTSSDVSRGTTPYWYIQPNRSAYGQDYKLEIWDWQLEKGTKATDWGLAEEDRVNKTNVLSSINLSTEGVKIQGAKIDIAGLVTVLNADGSAGTMINGSKLVTGSVTANELNINNIFGNSAVIAKIQSDSVRTASLDAGKITTGTLNAARIASSSISAEKLAANSVTAAKIAANAITAGKIAADAVTTRELKVDSLSAISTNIGTITAGTINGIDIVGSTLTSYNSNNDVIAIDRGTIEAFEQGRATFRVSASGLEWFSPSTGSNVGSLSPSYYSADDVGMTLVGEGDYLDIGQHTGDSSYRTQIGLRWRKNSYDYLRIHGGGGFNENARIELFSSGRIGSAGSDIPKFYLEDMLASSGTDWARAAIFTGRAGKSPSSNNFRSGFEVWQYQGDRSQKLMFEIDTDSSGNSYIDARVDRFSTVGSIDTKSVATNAGGINGGITLNNSSGDGGHVLSVAANAGHFYLYGNRANSQYPFAVRSHVNRSSYRNDFVINHSGYIVSTRTHSNTGTWNANMYVGASGQFYRVTSSRKYKLAIEKYDKNPYSLHKLNPKTWYDKKSVEKYADFLTRKHNGENVNCEELENIRRIPGLIAEEVRDAGLEMYLNYDEKDEISGVAYDRLWTLLIPISRDHEEKITNLYGLDSLKAAQISSLKSQVNGIIPATRELIQDTESRLRNEISSLRMEVSELKNRIVELEKDSA